MRPNSRTQLRGKINAFLIFLAGHLTQPRIGHGASNAVVLGGKKYAILATTIDQYQRDAATGSSRVFTLLQRSIREGLQPYETRTFALLFLAATSLRNTLVDSIRIAAQHAVGAQADPCGETGRVRGKSSAARKFQRLGVTSQLEPKQRELVDRHHRAQLTINDINTSTGAAFGVFSA